MFSISVSVKSPMGRELITSFSLSVNTHDKIAIIGEEGNGKTLFLKSVFDHEMLSDLQVERHLSNPGVVFGYLSQELSQEQFDMSVLDYCLSQQWDNYHRFRSELSRHFPELSVEDERRSLRSFSGGERVKLQIIRLLIQDVDCYLLDEPTNDLDLETLTWLQSWLMQQAKPILFVSHDLTMIRSVADRIVHFEMTHRKTKSKVTVFEGNYDDYVSKRNHLIENHNRNVSNEKRHREQSEERWQRLYHQVHHAQKTVSRQDPAQGRLLKKKMKAVKSMRKRWDNTEMAKKIETEDSITLYFDDRPAGHHKRLFQVHCRSLRVDTKRLGGPYSLDIYSQDRIACIGRNGIGKTTFLHELEHAAKQAGIRYAVMHQDYDRNIDINETPLNNLMSNPSPQDVTKIITRLGNLKFTSKEINRPIRHLSGGQKAKISLLKLVLSDPDVLLLDEPTRNLSPLSMEVIFDMLLQYRGAIFCITHDRALISCVFSTVLEFTFQGLNELPV